MVADWCVVDWGWARIRNRKTAGWVLAMSFLLLIMIGVVAPKADSVEPGTQTNSEPSTTPATTITKPIPKPAPTPATSSEPTLIPATPAPTTPVAIQPFAPSVPSTAAPVPAPELPAPAPAPRPLPAPTADAPAPRAGVTPGAFCSPDGAPGISKTGKPMVCGPAGDGRSRWHQP
ncbi:hypothetical protein NBRGN_024_00420 [Nocardia brasiliensis NBRC 14402]|nr:hypothetical protein NBRGN_024_00420 [Nocardia brasiliensis NBRC 14402]